LAVIRNILDGPRLCTCIVLQYNCWWEEGSLNKSHIAIALNRISRIHYPTDSILIISLLYLSTVILASCKVTNFEFYHYEKLSSIGVLAEKVL